MRRASIVFLVFLFCIFGYNDTKEGCLMSTLTSHDFQELESMITIFLKEGKVEGTHSLIKTIKFISVAGDPALTHDANQLLIKASKQLKDLLILKRIELDAVEYEKWLEVFRDTSTFESGNPLGVPAQSVNDEYLTTGEVAKKIGVSPQTVLNMIQDGRIKAEKLSKHWRIPSSQFKEVDKKINDLRKVVHQLHSSIRQEVTDDDLEEI
jgi:excisionase family DNA binding protein